MARLFVAVYPPLKVIDALAALPRADAHGVRWVPTDQFHVTLRFLGTSEVDEVVTRLDVVSPDLSVATVTLGPQVSRLGRNVVCVPAAGLGSLAGAVAKATADLGQPPDPRPFRGHITLARLRHRAACGLTGMRFEATFVAGQIDLVESITRPRGAQHSIVGSWRFEN